MQQYIVTGNYVKNKKVAIGFPYYNPYLRQHVIIADGAVYFYDTEYNLLFKEPALRAAEEVHFVDEDLCVLTIPYLHKVVFYSMKLRAIVNRMNIQLPKNIGTLQICSHALYCKKINTIIFSAWYKETELERFGSRSIFSYNMDTKEYACLYGGKLSECFGYKSKCYYANIYSQTDNFFLVFNDDLTYKKIKIDERFEELTKGKKRGFDPTNGLIIYHDKIDAFDGYTYYGKGTDCICIALDGSIQPWNPPRRFVEPEKKTKQKTKVIDDTSISKRGLKQEDFDTDGEEELLNEGYFWALDSLEKKAKKVNLSIEELIICNQATDEENILYSIGWFQTELTEGGIEQYFSNVKEKEFKCLIKALSLVGASETAKIIDKGATIKSEAVGNNNFIEKKFAKLEEKLSEDYVGMAIKYIKKSKGLN